MYSVVFRKGQDEDTQQLSLSVPAAERQWQLSPLERRVLKMSVALEQCCRSWCYSSTVGCGHLPSDTCSNRWCAALPYSEHKSARWS